MAYTTLANILAVNADLPQTSTTGGYSQTAAIIGAHIVRAEAFINGKLARRYDVPFTTTPPLVGIIAEDITSYYTYRSLYAKDNHNTSQRISEYGGDGTTTAFALLEQIRIGEIDLVTTAGALISERTTEQTDSVQYTNESYTPIFDVDDTMNWSVDSDRLTAISEARN